MFLPYYMCKNIPYFMSGTELHTGYLDAILCVLAINPRHSVIPTNKTDPYIQIIWQVFWGFRAPAGPSLPYCSVFCSTYRNNTKRSLGEWSGASFLMLRKIEKPFEIKENKGHKVWIKSRFYLVFRVKNAYLEAERGGFWLLYKEWNRNSPCGGGVSG